MAGGRAGRQGRGPGKQPQAGSQQEPQEQQQNFAPLSSLQPAWPPPLSPSMCCLPGPAAALALLLLPLPPWPHHHHHHHRGGHATTTTTTTPWPCRCRWWPALVTPPPPPPWSHHRHHQPHPHHPHHPLACRAVVELRRALHENSICRAPILNTVVGSVALLLQGSGSAGGQRSGSAGGKVAGLGGRAATWQRSGSAVASQPSSGTTTLRSPPPCCFPAALLGHHHPSLPLPLA